MPRRFVLVHSPVVGPGTWTPVAKWLSARGHFVSVPSLLGVAHQAPPAWPFVAEHVGEAVAEGEARAVLVLHSHGGLYAPHIAAASPGRIEAMIFADASVPPDAGQVALVPAEFLSELRGKADDGALPRWTDWWADDDVAALFPDEPTRRRTVEEQPRLSLSYYEQILPIEVGWGGVPCGYLLFSEGYVAEADEARARGWPVAEASGEHLHMMVDPPAVGEALERLADTLSGRSSLA